MSQSLSNSTPLTVMSLENVNAVLLRLCIEARGYAARIDLDAVQGDARQELDEDEFSRLIREWNNSDRQIAQNRAITDPAIRAKAEIARRALLDLSDPFNPVLVLIASLLDDILTYVPGTPSCS